MCSWGARRVTVLPPHRLFMVSLGSQGFIVKLTVFCTAANTFQIRGLAHVVNASLLVFIISAANSDLYIASRTLHGLALLGHAPRIFRKVTKRGVPIWALLLCWLFSMLVFLNVAEGPQNGASPGRSPHAGPNLTAPQYSRILSEQPSRLEESPGVSRTSVQSWTVVLIKC
jgi:Amino acid permease